MFMIYIYSKFYMLSCNGTLGKVKVKCVQGFGGETWGKETTGETQA
jgi:hypothetical protein